MAETNKRRCDHCGKEYDYNYVHTHPPAEHPYQPLVDHVTIVLAVIATTILMGVFAPLTLVWLVAVGAGLALLWTGTVRLRQSGQRGDRRAARRD